MGGGGGGGGGGGRSTEECINANNANNVIDFIFEMRISVPKQLTDQFMFLGNRARYFL